MEKILKFFPVIPAKGDTGKLILAILLYAFGAPLAGSIVSSILGFTIILVLPSMVVAVAACNYGIIGIILSFLAYKGIDITKKD